MRPIFDKTIRPVFLILRGMVSRGIERRHGIETSRNVGIDALGFDPHERRGHKPSEWTVLPRILRKREVASDDVFIDFGSGLGRVVFQAAAGYPFRRVIGVELSEQLNNVARRNVAKNLHRLRCQDVTLVAGDVLDYEIPDDVTVAFFANPFTGTVFATVLARLLASVDRKPRQLRIIYRNPVEHEMLLSTGRVRPVRRLRGFRPTADWSRSNSTRMYVVTREP